MNDNKKEDIIYESVIIAIILIIISAIIYKTFIIKYFQIPECIIYNKFRNILSRLRLYQSISELSKTWCYKFNQI